MSALQELVKAIQLHCARHCEPRRQNGQSKPFSRSRRAACFLWYFLSLRKKVLPPSGRKPHCSRRSRRVNPPESVSFRQSWRTLMLTVGFPLAPCSPLDRLPVQINNPMELQVPPRAVVGASAPRLGNASGKVDVHRHRQGFFLGANNRRGLHCRVLRSLLI